MLHLFALEATMFAIETFIKRSQATANREEKNDQTTDNKDR